MKTKRFWIVSVVVTLVLAGFVSLFASASPDGLESVLLTGCETTDGEITGGACVLQAAGGAFLSHGHAPGDHPHFELGATLPGKPLVPYAVAGQAVERLFLNSEPELRKSAATPSTAAPPQSHHGPPPPTRAPPSV